MSSWVHLVTTRQSSSQGLSFPTYRISQLALEVDLENILAGNSSALVQVSMGVPTLPTLGWTPSLLRSPDMYGLCVQRCWE